MGGFRGAIPAQLDWLRSTAAGRAWLEALPGAVEECAERWDLELGEPFSYAFTSLAVPARRSDGADVVVKVRWLDEESEQEPLALRMWDGDGAIRLLDELAPRNAMLLERCIPGTPVPPEIGLGVIEKLLPRLWKRATAPPFRSLAEQAGQWASTMKAQWADAGKPFPEKLVDAALDAIAGLAGTQGEQVLLHQDLHGWNVLAAQREPWLVIDPKPLVGEREFGPAPVIRSAELGKGRRETLRRLDHLTSELGLDRERTRMWCLAQTVAWSMGEGYLPEHIEVAGWLLDA